MKNQQGFVSAGILIAIVLGLVVLGGGAYYVIQPHSSSPNPPESSLDALPTVSTQTTETTATDPAPTQQETKPAPITYTSANLTASPTTGATPLAVKFSGRIEVPSNQRGSAIMFFGDGVSDVMFRSGPSLFNEEWSHTYSKPGEYDAVLVLTSISNVDSDIEVMKNPNYYKNVVVKKIQVSVGSAAPTSASNVSLKSNGLGIVNFGASSEQIIPQLTTVFGAPSKDTGWIDSFSTYGTCPGDKIRVVEWDRLRIFFGDTIFGTQKFFQWEYTGRDTTAQIPVIATDKGVTLEMSKSQVQSLYPQAQIMPWIENYEYMHLVPYNGTTHEYLGGTLQDSKVFWLSGGLQCGE